MLQDGNRFVKIIHNRKKCEDERETFNGARVGTQFKV